MWQHLLPALQTKEKLPRRKKWEKIPATERQRHSDLTNAERCKAYKQRYIEAYGEEAWRARAAEYRAKARAAKAK